MQDSLADAPAEDRLFPAFRALAAALAREGILVLPGDLEGLGGASFRAYWHHHAKEEGAPRWSLLSTAACSGDPVARAAESFGYRIAGGEDGRGVPGIGPVARVEGSAENTLRERIDRFERSLLRGAALAGEGEYRPASGGVFASGVAAYDRILADLDLDAEALLPESTDEARDLLLGDPRFDDAPERLLRRIALLAPLRDFAVAFGAARIRLALYLERAANFIDSSASAVPFRDEGKALLRAARFLPDPSSPATWREAGRLGAAVTLHPGPPERRLALARELRRARRLYRRASGLLHARAAASLPVGKR
ncbi:MAG: hypothetical protein JW958_09335 [Candidatus Eisenbacteria bacterium]|nr:hypothetical protein [Candidatus Eisenbacteria bacterium]